MPLSIVRNDITKMRVDAVVNAANEGLRRGGGVCGAIFAAAGVRELEAACNRIGHCNTGDAVATPAFGLPARHVIHAVGPIWQGGDHGEEKALRGCYRKALLLAHELGDTSIAFPLISSGIYGYPKGAAIDVAMDQIRLFLRDHEMDVYLTIFDAEALREGRGRFARVAEYVDDQYVERSPYLRRAKWERPHDAVASCAMSSDATLGAAAEAAAVADGETLAEDTLAGGAPAKGTREGLRTFAPMQAAPSQSAARHAWGEGAEHGLLERLLGNMDAPFSVTLLKMIDERGLKDSDVYKRANMSRQHFSKIRTRRGYRPKKQTVLALAVALELSLDETSMLLERAGYALTHADERDVIVEYFIRQGEYDIYEINLALYAFDQPLLG